MKNLRKIVGIALVLAIGLAFTTCDNDTTSGGGDPGGPTFFGDELELSGQVWEEEWDWDEVEYTETFKGYTKFTGNLTIGGYDGGSGEIKNGQLAYSIGTPSGLYTLDPDPEYYPFRGYDDVQFSKQNVGWYSLVSFDVFDDNYGGYLSKTSLTTSEDVIYMYVDSDVTLSGKGKTNNWNAFTYITQNFSLALKAGWNAVYTKQQHSYSQATDTITTTVTIKLANPSLMWVLSD